MKIDRLAGDHKPVTMLWDIPTVLGHLSSFNRVERLDLVQYMVEMAIDQQIQSLVGVFRSLRRMYVPDLIRCLPGVKHLCNNLPPIDEP
jgi:hypothetical protein